VQSGKVLEKHIASVFKIEEWFLFGLSFYTKCGRKYQLSSEHCNCVPDCTVSHPRCSN